MEAGRLYWNKEHKKAFFTYADDFLPLRLTSMHQLTLIGIA